MIDPLRCERCGSKLESDDAISIIEGLCNGCRRHGHRAPVPMILDPAPAAARPPARPSAPRPAAPSRPAAGPSRSRPLQDLGLPRPRVSPPFVAATLHHEPAYSGRMKRRRRDLGIGIGVGLVVTVVFASIVLLNRADAPALTGSDTPIRADIDLKVEPAFASVKLDGQEIGPADRQGRLKLRLAGDATTTRWLEVSANGYLPMKRPLSLVGGAENITIELTRQAYEARIRTEPADAEVWIGGKYQGMGDVKLAVLPKDNPALIVKKIGYTEVRQALSAPERGGPLDLQIRLVPAQPELLVETDPPGAQVAVEGGAKAVSPAALPLPPGVRGTDVVVSASMAGHEDARVRVSVPASIDAPLPPTRVKLAPVRARVEIATQPPGGRVLIDGEDLGTAPLTAQFGAGEAGRSIEIEAILGSTHQGHRRIAIPEPGQLLAVQIPMDLVAQRVVFLVDPASHSQTDLVLVANELARQIHDLGSNQRFAVLTCGGKVAAWPAAGRFAPASSEQKVRAYDLIRLLRPAARASLVDGLKAAQAMDPTTIVCISAGGFNCDALEDCRSWLQPSASAVHLISLRSGEHDERLQRFAARCRGSYRVVGGAPVIAMQGDTQD